VFLIFSNRPSAATSDVVYGPEIVARSAKGNVLAPKHLESPNAPTFASACPRRLRRLISLIGCLRSGENRRSVEELQRDYHVSRRTIFRDFATLRSAGIEICHSPEYGHYHISTGSIAPLDLLTAADFGALLAILDDVIIQSANETRRHAAVQARARIEQFTSELNEDIREQIRSSRDQITTGPEEQIARLTKPRSR